MNVNELKNLVKSYFNLQEIVEKFGSVKDVNGAFTLKFEGDALEVGKKVSIETAEGQTLDAPDGFHELEGGIKIKTEGSVVTELEVEKHKVEEMYTKPKNEAKVFAELEEEDIKDTLEIPELAQAIAEVVKAEMDYVKKEMAELKAKVEKMSAEPAVEKTLPKNTFSANTNNIDAVDPKRYAMMREILKTKSKNLNPTN
jgi:hypothetical protein